MGTLSSPKLWLGLGDVYVGGGEPRFAFPIKRILVSDWHLLNGPASAYYSYTNYSLFYSTLHYDLHLAGNNTYTQTTAAD